MDNGVPAVPAMRPARPHFSSGPCAKPPGWKLENLRNAFLGRSHRSKPGLARLKEAIDRTRSVLQVPADYLIGIVPASDTGAIELAMWNLLGPRPVQVVAFDGFGRQWAIDAGEQLKLDSEVLSAAEGEAPDFARVRPGADVIFTWNGTTSGVRVPNADFIAADRTGLTLCDATSAAFAMPLDWPKLDVVTFSWQKALGGEAAHGMLVLSPRAVERIESHTPAWPLPKIFRIRKEGRIDRALFEGETLNTPSMLCVEDWLEALRWAQGVGGLPELRRRTLQNFAVLSQWVGRTPWIDFLARDPAVRSETSVTLKFVDPEIAALPEAEQRAFIKRFTGALEREGAAYDIASHRDAPPGLRIWCGATVETEDLDALTPWLDWAFQAAKAEAA